MTTFNDKTTIRATWLASIDPEHVPGARGLGSGLQVTCSCGWSVATSNVRNAALRSFGRRVETAASSRATHVLNGRIAGHNLLGLSMAGAGYNLHCSCG